MLVVSLTFRVQKPGDLLKGKTQEVQGLDFYSFFQLGNGVVSVSGKRILCLRNKQTFPVIEPESFLREAGHERKLADWNLIY